MLSCPSIPQCLKKKSKATTSTILQYHVPLSEQNYSWSSRTVIEVGSISHLTQLLGLANVYPCNISFLCYWHSMFFRHAVLLVVTPQYVLRLNSSFFHCTVLHLHSLLSPECYKSWFADSDASVSSRAL